MEQQHAVLAAEQAADSSSILEMLTLLLVTWDGQDRNNLLLIGVEIRSIQNNQV